jgi:hypothetical protein
VGAHRSIRVLTAGLLVLALAFAAACGSKSAATSTGAEAATSAQSTTGAGNIHLPTAKFLLHAGLAFGAFHRYIYKPFKAGTFKHPLLHKLALVKAAAAALFIGHELKKASEDAKASALLRKLFSPLQALATTVSGLSSGLRSGHADAATLGSANGAIEAIKQGASSAGLHVSENANVVP